MDTLLLKTSETDGVFIVHVTGYVSLATVGDIQKVVDDFLARGGRAIILDLTECPAINSHGITAIMTMTMRVTDDFQGNVVIVTLDPVKVSVFELVGIFPIASLARNLPDAVRVAKAGL
jgi:anti-anti-sigma factor